MRAEFRVDISKVWVMTVGEPPSGVPIYYLALDGDFDVLAGTFLQLTKSSLMGVEELRKFLVNVARRKVPWPR